MTKAYQVYQWAMRCDMTHAELHELCAMCGVDVRDVLNICGEQK